MNPCKLIQLSKISDVRGNLTFIESSKHIPFEIRRVYYLYDVPGDESRGGHAHKNLEQLIISISGSFDITIDTGYLKETYTLRRPYYGLYIPSLVWRTMENFSTGSACLVLASKEYDESDYYRDYDDFIAAKKELTNV